MTLKVCSGRVLLPVAALLLAALACTPSSHKAPAASSQHMLWALSGAANTIYLMGSLHVLRPDDYPLPAALNAAYDDAHTLVLELSPDELAPAVLQRELLTRGYLEPGKSLRQWLGDADYDAVARKSATLDINIASLDHVEPWLAAMTIMNIQIRKLGFSPDQGVETHFAARANSQGKPVLGLETLTQQLDIFDGLSRADQSRLLQKTLDDAAEMEEELDTLVAAWKQGDDARLSEEMLQGFDEFPAMYETLVVRRNVQWLDKIEPMTRSADNHLVIVGTLHLVGKDSLVELLRGKGYKLRRL